MDSSRSMDEIAARASEACQAVHGGKLLHSPWLLKQLSAFAGTFSKAFSALWVRTLLWVAVKVALQGCINSYMT